MQALLKLYQDGGLIHKLSSSEISRYIIDNLVYDFFSGE